MDLKKTTIEFVIGDGFILFEHVIYCYLLIQHYQEGLRNCVCLPTSNINDSLETFDIGDVVYRGTMKIPDVYIESITNMASEENPLHVSLVREVFRDEAKKNMDL